ncbi:putative cytochrome P450 [Nocardia nova SH22a]|uniref:Putative cytochrome P450 n=1 Tax=Nocardia nova SH22a TaxID=1415166 RepID=W5TEV5_9NOCA|nr:cytochrome P450 [Nocardia nova]AHH17767.1 putative cytochrome P450 [Nocardia nova SH22a]
MSMFDEIDFFTDKTIVDDPYPYFESLRARCPVAREPHHGVLAVTGYDAAVEVYRNHEIFSSCVAPSGPFPGLPFDPEGADIGAMIDKHREAFPLHEHMVTFDQPQHTAHRDLLKALFTPRRLKQNEEFMWVQADRMVDEFIERGKVEFLHTYAQPFAMLVIANLLGVPEEDYSDFRRVLSNTAPPGAIDDEVMVGNPLEFLAERFTSYLEERRVSPRGDVLSALAAARFPDGSLPEIAELVHLSSFLFAAGQETTARVMTAGVRVLAENPGIQHTLRAENDRIGGFVEECLRLEAPVKTDFRLAREDTTIGGVDVPAGSMVMVLPGAANRDPSRFENANAFDADRANAREHISFARGIHTCPGGPLARMESRITFERILRRMSDIRISDAEHGPAGNRTFEYEPTYVLRGLTALHIEFDRAG